MSGKIKTLHGVYKALGRDAFLAAAKEYSAYVQKTIEATLSEMEGHWYDESRNITEANKMVEDFQRGHLTSEMANKMLEQENLRMRFEDNINSVLKKVDFVRLECSCNGTNKSYAEEVLGQMHDAFVSAYGTDHLEEGMYDFVQVPAVIRSSNSGKLCLGVVVLDMESSGEHWGTDFLTLYGVIPQGDPYIDKDLQAYIKDTYIPYDYWYTANVDGDIHVSFENVPQQVSDLLSAARGEQQIERDFDMKM